MQWKYKLAPSRSKHKKYAHTHWPDTPGPCLASQLVQCLLCSQWKHHAFSSTVHSSFWKWLFPPSLEKILQVPSGTKSYSSFDTDLRCHLVQEAFLYLLPSPPLAFRISNMLFSCASLIERVDTSMYFNFVPRASVQASLVAQMVKSLPAMQETWVRSLGMEDPLEKGIATHSSILAWGIP